MFMIEYRYRYLLNYDHVPEGSSGSNKPSSSKLRFCVVVGTSTVFIIKNMENI